MVKVDSVHNYTHNITSSAVQRSECTSNVRIASERTYEASERTYEALERTYEALERTYEALERTYEALERTIVFCYTWLAIRALRIIYGPN